MTLMNTYSPLAISFEKGEGAYLYSQGNQYLDLISGIAVCGLGHANLEIAEAISKQARTLIHTSNLYQIGKQQELAQLICDISGMKQVFFGNSGAEANEAAIKLARKYANSRKIKDPKIIVMENSFHGRTMATLSATGNEKVQSGFEPLVGGFVRVPFNDIPAIQELAKSNNNIVAILVEPIQGEGGVNIPDSDYLPKLRTICDQNSWLLMLDEIQTGMGRTGTMFNFQQFNIKPDVLTVAKGLGNGVPIGACLTNKAIFEAGNHGSTFGGNLLSAQAALTTLSIIERDNLCIRAQKLGDIIFKELNQELSNYPVKIRYSGLMIAIELDRPCSDLAKLALNEKILINVTAANVVRLLPPLILTNVQANYGAIKVAELIKTFLDKN